MNDTEARVASFGWGRGGVLLVVVGLAVTFGMTDLYNFDLGLARATGRWIVENGVPHTNVFSAIHAERPFVDDKWLFHLLAYGSVDRIGERFTVVARTLLVAWLAILLVPRRRLQSGTSAAIAATVAMIGLVTASERFGFRPELFSMVFLGLFAQRLMRSERLTRREIALLLIVQLLWTNVHGYFVLGPMLAGVTLVGSIFDRLRRREPWRRERWRGGLLVALVAICFVNPYGWRLVVSPVEILLDLKGNHSFYSEAIVEFARPFAYQAVLPSDLIAYRVLLVAALLALVAVRRRGLWVEWLPLALFFWMSLDIRRNIAPFAVVAAPMVASSLIDAAERLSAKARRFCRVQGVVLVTVATSLFVGLVWLQRTQRLAVHDRLEKTVGWGGSAWAHPDAEVDFVLEHLPADGMFNSFSFGSYFVGRAFPERKPFIDGNTSGYPVEFFQRYAAWVTQAAPIDEAIEEYHLRYFLIKPGHPLAFSLLRRDDAVPLYLGRHAIVIGLRGRLDDSLLDRFDLRRRDDLTSIGTTSPVSDRWQRWLPTAELNQARYFDAIGDSVQALRACEAATVINDEVYEPFLQQASILLKEGNGNGAIRACDAGLERAAGVAELYALRGMAKLRQRDRDGAASDLDRAIGRDPSRAEFLEWRGRVALEEQDTALAETLALRAIERDDRCYLAHLLLGRAYESMGRLELAIEALIAARDRCPTRSERDEIEVRIEELSREEN